MLGAKLFTWNKKYVFILINIKRTNTPAMVFTGFLVIWTVWPQPDPPPTTCEDDMQGCAELASMICGTGMEEQCKSTCKLCWPRHHGNHAYWASIATWRRCSFCASFVTSWFYVCGELKTCILMSFFCIWHLFIAISILYPLYLWLFYICCWGILNNVYKIFKVKHFHRG